MEDQSERDDSYTIFFHEKPLYDDYAISPFQLERIVKEGDYKVHINQYGERVFGPPIKRGEEIN